MTKRRAVLLACMASACGTPQLAAAQAAGPAAQTFWSVEGGVEHTDNVRRVPVDEESETVGVAALAFGITADRPRLDADISGRVEYRDYLDDVYESEVVGGIDGLVTYAFIPERFTWMVADNYGQIADNRTLPDTPDNRENFNYFTTGPDITFALTQRTLLRLSGRYSDTYYEESPEGSQSYGGTLALIRQISEMTSVSLNASTTEIDYDEPLFVDYRMDQAFLRWSRTSELLTLALDVGYNSIDQDLPNSDESSGLLARLELSKPIGTRSRIGFDIGTEYVTSGDEFRLDQSNTGVSTGAEDTLASGDPYQLDYAYVTWATDWDRTALTVTANARSEAHDVDTLSDRDVYGALVRLSRQVSRRFDAAISGSYDNEEFVNANFKFKEWRVGLDFGWQFTERLSLSIRLDHYDGSSDDGTRDFEENRAYLGIVYARHRT